MVCLFLNLSVKKDCPHAQTNSSFSLSVTAAVSGLPDDNPGRGLMKSARSIAMEINEVTEDYVHGLVDEWSGTD